MVFVLSSGWRFEDHGASAGLHLEHMWCFIVSGLI
jgi:hypothetical protein